MTPINDDDDILIMDHEQTNTTQQTTSTSWISCIAAVSRVAIKAPPCYRTNPAVWFRQMESQFVLGRVSTDDTKFRHVLASLPEDVAVNLVVDINSYAELKDSVIKLFQNSKNELLEEVLGAQSL